MAESVSVRVNATSANVGPGFDSMGVAVAWADELSLTLAEGLSVEVWGEGESVVPRDERHLVVKSLRRGLRAFGHPDPEVGFSLQARNAIPHSRGLGSSAAAIAAGYGLAWGLAHPDEPLDRDAVLQLVSADEGHPDNAAAVIYGGAVLAWRRSDRDEYGHVCLELDPGLRARVWVPRQELPTATARQVLPEMLSRELVVAQASRTALLVHALSGHPELLVEATQDWLHQQARGALMPASLNLITTLRSVGVAAVVSGAGPTVLALGTAEQLERSNQVTSEGFDEHEVSIGGGLELRVG